MKLQSVLVVVLCTGVYSLPAAHQERYDSKLDRDVHEDDGRGLEQVDWTSFAQEFAERNKPTQLPTMTPKPTSRSGAWGIITRVPTYPTEQSESSVVTRTRFPTKRPSRHPTPMPSESPSGHPTLQPTTNPSDFPSASPTLQPSVQPSVWPTTTPSLMPSSQPTSNPSTSPSYKPSVLPSSQPSAIPSASPTSKPSSSPSSQPSIKPTSASPSIQPTNAAGYAGQILSSEEKNNMQVSLEASTERLNNGVKLGLGSAAVVLIGALLVKRDVILGKEEEEEVDEEDEEDEDEEIEEAEEWPSSSSDIEANDDSSDIEEGCDNGNHNITYPLPPSAAIDTRTYKTKERLGLPPFHILASCEQPNNISPIHCQIVL